MLGKNHIVTNTCSLTLGSIAVLYCKDYYTGFLSDKVKDTANSIYDFALNSDYLPRVLKNFYSAICDKTGISFISLYIGLCFVLFVIGSLLPDIDSKNSALGRYIHIPVKHRTWTHSILIPVLMFIGTIKLPFLFWIALGYTLHLFWDSLSRAGICWFYPLSHYADYGGNIRVKKHHYIKLYRTGCISEYVLVCIVILITIFTVICFICL